jgi:hypothetical protein
MRHRWASCHAERGAAGASAGRFNTLPQDGPLDQDLITDVNSEISLARRLLSRTDGLDPYILVNDWQSCDRNLP